MSDPTGGDGRETLADPLRRLRDFAIGATASGDAGRAYAGQQILDVYLPPLAAGYRRAVTPEQVEKAADALVRRQAARLDGYTVTLNDLEPDDRTAAIKDVQAVIEAVRGDS